jgi:hypothetical protein
VLKTRDVTLEPLVEVSYGRIAKVGAGFFDIGRLYGDDRFWSWSLGLRASLGGGIHRMGRYGAAANEASLHHRNGR